MNRARVAAARAKLHEALDELLDALMDASANDGPPLPTESNLPKPRATRPITDIDKARARKALRKLGLDL